MPLARRVEVLLERAMLDVAAAAVLHARQQAAAAAAAAEKE
jgi:hypothetical protein